MLPGIQELLIGLVYHSSNCEVNEVSLNGFEIWLSSGRCLTLGNFNPPTIKWKNPRTELLENSFEQELVDLVISCAVVRHVKETTRYDPDSKSSLLDLILTHYDDDATNLDYIPPPGKSDYAVLGFDFQIAVSNENVSAQAGPNVWKANIRGTIHSLSLVDWTLEPEYTIGTSWKVFRDLYIKFSASHIPWTTQRGSSDSLPWLTEEVHNLLRKRRMWET